MKSDLLQKFFVIVLSALVLWGCGGSGGPNTAASQGNYTGQTGVYELLVTADDSGNASAQISSAQGIAYAGTGSVNSAGVFDITLNKVGTGSGSVNLTGTNVGGNVTFSLSGDIIASGIPATFTSASVSVYKGSYIGGYTGTVSGSFQFQVGDDGTLTGTATYGTGNVTLAGHLNSIGGTSTAVSGSVPNLGTNVTFTGSFFLDAQGGRHASGTWSASDGSSGSWTSTP